MSTRTRLIGVWAFLSLITISSWLLSREGGATFQARTTITAAVLLMAAVKAHLVIRNFMEVSSAPVWLKRTTAAWVIALVGMLLAICLMQD